MQRDAGIIRRRGLALPAKLEIDATGPVAERVVELLEDSPRFDFDGEGFSVTVTGSGREVEVCLREPAGGLLSCANMPPEPQADADAETPKATDGGEGKDPEELDDDDYAAMTAAAFHKHAFAMPVGLSDIDLGSLDGTPTISDEAARERMQGLLDDMAEKSG